jgi:NAD(P)H-quinone oxidoreductase subunit 5
LLIAAITMHHMVGEGDFGGLMNSGIWPEGTAAVTSSQALLVGTLLLIGAAGKSALFPFSGWLPRAMEGPTPSSAIFYGALSVHLGAYLLLRLSPLIEASLALQMMVLSLGAISAIGGALMSRVQNDVKTSLAFASLTQVGIIVVEIGLGLRYLALIHIIGHATLRTMQLLRAPTLIRDYNDLENKIGSRLQQPSWSGVRWLPQSLQHWCYRFGFDRGFMDIALDRWVAGPFLKFFRTCNAWEQNVARLLSNEPGSSTEEASPDSVNEPSQDISTAA